MFIDKIPSFVVAQSLVQIFRIHNEAVIEGLKDLIDNCVAVFVLSILKVVFHWLVPRKELMVRILSNFL